MWELVSVQELKRLQTPLLPVDRIAPALPLLQQADGKGVGQTCLPVISPCQVQVWEVLVERDRPSTSATLNSSNSPASCMAVADQETVAS